MYEIQSCTLPLTHGGVQHLKIYGNGYIMDAEAFVGGYSTPYCEIHYVSLEDGDSYKEVRILVLERGKKIAPADIHLTIPIKTIRLEKQVYLITAQYL